MKINKNVAITIGAVATLGILGLAVYCASKVEEEQKLLELKEEVNEVDKEYSFRLEI